MIGEAIEAIFRSGGMTAFLAAVVILCATSIVMFGLLLLIKRSARLAWEGSGKPLAESMASLPFILQQMQADHTMFSRTVEDLADVHRSVYAELRALTQAMHASHQDTQRELLELTRAVLLRLGQLPAPPPKTGHERP
jgi:hypothetical protein